LRQVPVDEAWTLSSPPALSVSSQAPLSEEYEATEKEEGH